MLQILRIFAALFLLNILGLHHAIAEDTDVTPLRLSYINGSVSFWRNGAEDWAEARINTPLVRGDALYAGHNSELELQADSRSFIRAADDAQITVIDKTEDYMQLKVVSGRISLDMRSLPAANYSIELDTPNSVINIDRPGYYRLDVGNDVRFVTRRGGQATIMPAGGETIRMQASEELIVRGMDSPRAEVLAASAPDDWDRWNYNRGDEIADAASDRYLPPNIAGTSDLDRYGSWNVMEDYGPVWIPADIPIGWVPYSSGRWIWDPYYQWTWIDDAPWGWAPFHYGRWMCRDNRWMWAPGVDRHRRPSYAPALVGFYGPPPVRSGISISTTGSLGWVALGWGEPVVPWWGRPGFIGHPYWGGWNGPRMINNRIVRNNMSNINRINYANSQISNAVVTAPVDRFGKAPVHTREESRPRQFTPLQGALPVQPNPIAATAGAPKGLQPPAQILTRPTVVRRPPPEIKQPWRIGTPQTDAAAPQTVIVSPQPVQKPGNKSEIGTKPVPALTNDVRTVPAPDATQSISGGSDRITDAPIQGNRKGALHPLEADKPLLPVPPDTNREVKDKAQQRQQPWQGDNKPHQVIVTPPPVPDSSSGITRSTTDQLNQGADLPRQQRHPTVNEAPRSFNNRDEPKPWHGDNRPHQVIVPTPPVSATPRPSPRAEERSFERREAPPSAVVAPQRQEEMPATQAKPWKGDNRPHQVIIKPPPVSQDK